MMDVIIISKTVLISVCVLIIFLCIIIYILSAQLMDKSEPIYIEEDNVSNESITIEDNLIIASSADLKDSITVIDNVIPETFTTSKSIDKEIDEKNIPIGSQLTTFKKK